MENKEKKKLTKWEIVIIVLGICFISIYFVIMFLSLLDVVPELRWVGHLSFCFAWLVIGFLNWKKTKWLSIYDYVLATAHAVLGVMELIRQYF